MKLHVEPLVALCDDRVTICVSEVPPFAKVKLSCLLRLPWAKDVLFESSAWFTADSTGKLDLSVVALCKSADLPAPVHENILHYLWVQYAITGGLWPALVRAGSFEEVLKNAEIGKQGLRAARECLEVTAQRGVDLKQHPEARMYLSTSPLAMWMANLAIKFMFRFNKVVRRSSLHGLGDAEEVQVFFYDLLNTGRNLGVNMPVMSSFEPDIRKFANQGGKS